MEHLELVEKLVAKTAVSYEDAKNALAACEWDLLDAMIYLEKLGKVQAVKPETVITRNEKAQKHAERKNAFKKGLHNFFDWCGEMIRKGNENFFNITKNGSTVMTIPVTVLVLLLLFAFGLIVPLLVVGLFFEYRYSFSGKSTMQIDLNGAMNKVSEMAEDLKAEFKNNSEQTV